MTEYTLIRSNRKTLSLQISADARVIVRAPRRMPQRDIDRFVREHEGWIREKLTAQQARLTAHPEPDAAREAELKRMAREIIPARVAHFSRIMGLTPTGLRITSARTRWGSCSAKNSLNFSWRLMDYPPEAIDYVVVHELAHIAHHDHSREFYALVASILPDYKERAALLKR